MLCAYWIVTLLNEPAAAAAAAELIVSAKTLDVSSLYNSACVFAECAAASKDDDTQQNKYADRAMAMLKQAVTAGWKDAAHIRKDTDLDPLRQREDFNKLLAEMEASEPKATEAATQENSAAKPGSQPSPKQPQ